MALKVEKFQPEGMNVRMAAGQPSYSHVVTVSGTGKLVFIAGQLARDIDGNCVGVGDMRAQIVLAMDNVETVLSRAGYSLADVVRLNYYTTNMEKFFEAYDAVTGRLTQAKCQPASTLLGVACLARPELMVEIEATAMK